MVPSLAPGTPYRQVRLVHRPDQQDHLRIVRGAYDPNSVLIPDYFATAMGVAPGATLHLLNGQTQVDTRLSGTYDTVPTDPTRATGAVWPTCSDRTCPATRRYRC